MALTLVITGRFVNRGIVPGGVFTGSSAFLLGGWFFIVFNALLTHFGFARGWGKLLLIEDPFLYTQAAIIAIVGMIFFTLGTFFSPLPTAPPGFTLTPLVKKDKTILLIVAILFFIPGNWAAVYSYNEVLLSSYWDRTTAIVTISNLIVPAALISVIGVITSVKRGMGSLLFFGIILTISISGLMLLWSRRAVLGIIFVTLLVLYARKFGKPSQKVIFILFPLLVAGAIILAFYRAYVFFQTSPLDMSFAEMMETYLEVIWLESSSFAALMFSAGPESDNELLYGSSFLAAFIFYIPRAIFPDKPYSYDLGTAIGDLQYNLPASFYGETIANFGVIAVPVTAFVLGYFIKKIDLKFYAKPRNIFELSIYLLFVFNMFFMVRGSFSTVVSSIVITCVLPLIAYRLLYKVTRMKKSQYIEYGK